MSNELTNNNICSYVMNYCGLTLSLPDEGYSRNPSCKLIRYQRFYHL